MNQLNKLNIHGLRRLSFCPPHFQKIIFDLRADEKQISDWIFEHTSGRFFLGQHIDNPSSAFTSISQCAGFELHQEASYFSLILDQINHT